MPRPFQLTLQRETVIECAPGLTRFKSPLFELTLPALSTSLSDAVDLLRGSGATSLHLERMAQAAGGEMEVLRLAALTF